LDTLHCYVQFDLPMSLYLERPKSEFACVELPYLAMPNFSRSVSFILANLRAISNGKPIGHIAGIGLAITGIYIHHARHTIANLCGQFYSGTTLPLFVGFSVCRMYFQLRFFMLMRNGWFWLLPSNRAWIGLHCFMSAYNRNYNNK